MIKIDHNYTDYRDDTDPKYPGGKAVNATTAESTDGTPLLADWMNDVNGALQAIFLEAFGDINKVSGKPDNVQESDVLKAIKEIIKKLLLENAFQYRGAVSKVDLDKVIDPGSYSVVLEGCSGVLLVFASYGSAGIVQFYKDGYQNEPWMCRNAVDSDTSRWTEWRFLGVQLTTNIPSNAECQRDSPWAASPYWVYNLLTGGALDDVNKTVTEALQRRLGVDSLFKNAFQYRGVVSKVDLDKVIDPGSYSVVLEGCSGVLLVFASYGSAGIVQFYKDGYQNEPWMCRNAVDSDTSRWTEWRFLGVQLTTNIPSNAECQRDSPWAASPRWVYNLLTGGALDDVNKTVTEALGNRVATKLFSGASFSGISCAVTVNGDSVFGPGGLPVPIKGYRWSFKGEVPLNGLYVCFWVIEKV